MIPAVEAVPVIPLRVVCAWCKTVLAEGGPGASTSHGICPACAAMVRADNGVAKLVRYYGGAR